MDTPFGVPWERLDLAALEAFLRDGPDESLTWEAKGGVVRLQHVRRAVCAFANSELGGFLLLGVARARPGDPWQFAGWTPPNEPALWIEDCLANGGVRPRPSIEVRAWPVGAGRQRVAVVAVRPAAVPPVLTADGEVMLRVSGSSRQVADPAVLRELLGRGRAAEARAVGCAAEVAARLFPVDALGRCPAFAIGLATPALPEDVSLRLYRQGIAERLGDELAGRLCAEPLGGGAYNRRQVRLDADGVHGWSASGFGDGRKGYSATLLRGGGCAVSWSDPEDVGHGAANIARYPAALRPAWGVLVDFAVALGAPPGSPAAVTLTLSRNEGDLYVDRWTGLREPTEDELASVAREAGRADGRLEWEPDRG